MTQKSFKSLDGLMLKVVGKKSAIIFELENLDPGCREEWFRFYFDSDTFKQLLEYIETVAKACWDNITPREIYSFSSDYTEYYDKKFDCNGCLYIKENALIIARPSLEHNKLYQFNKKRIETFIYDFREIINN